MCSFTMVKTTPKTGDHLHSVCLELLELEEKRGKKRVEMARELGTRPGSLTKWIERTQKISSTFLSRILTVYGGGMDAEKIARLIKAFSEKPEVLDKLLKIEESDDEEAVAKVDNEITFWADRVKK
jgi:hypothetical protein